MQRRRTVCRAWLGGWDVAARPLGIRPTGLEWDTAACETARAYGLVRVQKDVAATDPESVFQRFLRLLIMSPPCQAFSAAGKGLGRKGAKYILMGVQLIAWGNDPAQVCKWVDEQLEDERAALVLEPLRWVKALLPENIAMEQVAPVLPLWEAMADVFRSWGYSVWCGNLQAEQYDVPQTRKRAILIASRVRGVSEPVPVRRKYRKDRKTGETNRFRSFKLDPDGLKPWISMSDALHHGLTQRPSCTICAGGTNTGGAEPFGNGARQQMLAAQNRGDWQLRMNSSPHAAVRLLDEPSSTVFFGERVNAAEWQQRSNYSGPQDANGERERLHRELNEPSTVITSKLRHWERNPDGSWTTDRPATTVQGNPRIFEPGHKHRGPDCCKTNRDADGIRQSMFSGDAIRVTIQEAAVLQGFPADYPWQGKKGEQHRQVGDAVPPPLAWHILRALFGLPSEHYPGTENL